MKNQKSDKEVLDALMSYCDYQERCTFEVLNKLSKYEISDATKASIIQDLKEFNYLNDERYAATFVRGKHSLKGWGKNKIKAALYQKRIPNAIIEKALQEILMDEHYQEKLSILFEKKWSLLGNKKDSKTKQKLFRYLYSKGYESSLINNLIMDRIKT